MRNLIFIVIIFCSLAVNAEQFTVFEKDGFFGIKDQTGNVTVPPVYKKLGWSDGSSNVVRGVIGFRNENQWGLITVRNKALTDQQFYSIVPLSSGYFKASIKGRFSNHLFYGILDEKGRTIISFNYFTIENLGTNWLVSAFDGKRQQFGVVSFENELIIPTKYQEIREDHELLLATQPSQKIDLYRSSGRLLQLGLDSIRYLNGWLAHRDGYAGFLASNGEILYDFDFKSFSWEAGHTKPILFPEWTVYRQDSIFLKWKCDSLSVSANGLLMAYLNGAHHLLLSNSSLLNNHELILKEVSGDQLVVQNSKTRKWAVLSPAGGRITDDYDSIHSMGSYYACLDSRGWHVLTSDGVLKNRLPMQTLQPGLQNQFIVKRNHHWGILNEEDESTTFKYDSIITGKNEYLVSYLNRWGVLDENEKWLIRPEYNEIISIANLLIGRRGKGYTVFDNGNALYKTTARPILEIGSNILLKGDSSSFGLMDSNGEIIIWPEYDDISLQGDHFELRYKDEVALARPNGELIIRPDEGYQEIGGFGEGYFPVKKNNRWGLIDDQGRLRISNRYDGTKPFSEGLAAINLRGKWGFIDKDEILRIQPYYEAVNSFHNGKSIVQLDRKYGLVDEKGEEVLELIWKSIHRLNTGNYIVRDMNDRVGLVNEDGSFIFRPAFDHIQDFGDRVVVSKNGAWGILKYSGQPIFKINHEEIKVISDFTMVKN